MIGRGPGRYQKRRVRARPAPPFFSSLFALPCPHVRPVPLFGVVVQDLTLAELRGLVEAWFEEPRLHTVVTPNPEILLQAKKDEAFAARLNRADLSVPDGVGLQYAAAAFGDRLEHRHAGVDVLKELAAMCAAHGKSLMLLGGKTGSGEAAAAYLRGLYPTLRVEAHDPGTVLRAENGTWTMSPSTRDLFRLRRPSVVAVALGQGKQELFMEEVLSGFPDVRVAIGVGGALEMLGGVLPRAPQAWRDRGWEWLWRLGLEPRRFVRIARAVVVFPTTVALATLKQKKFFSACRRVFGLLLAGR